MIKNPDLYKKIMTKRLTHSGGKVLETPLGIRLEALTFRKDPTGKLVNDGGSQMYHLLSVDDLDSPLFEQVLPSLAAAKTILALPPDPPEPPFRMIIRRAEIGQLPKPLNPTLWICVPTLSSNAYRLPMPFYLDAGCRIWRVDAKDTDEKKGSTWLRAIEGGHTNLAGYQTCQAGIETEEKGGLCVECQFTLGFCGRHCITELAVEDKS